jgi:hypothetical protein
MAEYQSVLEFQTFLNTGIQPTSHALCGLVSLKTAVYVAMGLDVLLGGIYMAESILLILVNGLIPGEFEELVVSLVGNSVSVVTIPFAIMGVIALRTSVASHFHMYFLYKCFEVLFLSIFDPATSYIYCYGQGWVCEVVTLVCLLGQKIGIDLYVLYLVWSMDVALRLEVHPNTPEPKSFELVDLQDHNS